MKYSLELFIKNSNNIHNGKYDYSETTFTRLRDKVDILCKSHGLFTQRAQAHINGSGCNLCYSESRNLSFYGFKEIVNKIHNDKYEYNDYISLKKKLVIICKKHGEFKQVAEKHLLGQGCSKCFHGSSRLSQSEFLKKSNDVHENKYDYSNAIYKNYKTKVCIICKKHGEFFQTPNNHISNKKGCPKCSRIVSKMETKWLDSMLNDSIIRQFNIFIGDKSYKVDGYDPNTKSVYEFYGDFWHGNINIYNKDDFNNVSKKKFIDLYMRTLERESELIENGYKVISIWEKEFKKL
jgi:hypothetical protein